MTKIEVFDYHAGEIVDTIETDCEFIWYDVTEYSRNWAAGQHAADPNEMLMIEEAPVWPDYTLRFTCMDSRETREVRVTTLDDWLKEKTECDTTLNIVTTDWYIP